MSSVPARRMCALVLFVAVTATGCGGGDKAATGKSSPSGNATAASSSAAAGSSSAPAGSTSAVCADVAALKATTAKLDDTKVSRGALSELAQQVSQLASDVTKLKNHSSGPYAADVHAVDQAAESVRSSLTAASASPSVRTVRAVGTSLQALGASVAALGDAVKKTC